MKPAIYIRVSTEEQAREGFSLGAQLERCRALAASRGLQAPAVYEDAGISGGAKVRPGFDRLLKDIEAGKISHVIVWRLDRLTRRMSQLVGFAEMVQECGVELLSHSENVNTDNAAGRLFMHQMGSFNAYFLELQTENIKAGMQKRSSEGKWSTSPPTGGKVIDGRLVWGEESDAVKRAFQLAAEDVSLHEIARRTGINPSTLRGVIRNPVYIGKVRTNGGIFDGEHEPLISQELFERVQKVKPVTHHRWQSDKASHPLSGFVRCGNCRRVMSVGRSGKGIYQYHCVQRSGRKCEGVGSRAEAKVIRAFTAAGDLLKNSQQLRKDLREVWEKKAPPDVSGEIKKLSRELAGVNRKIEKATDYMLEHDETSEIWRKKLVMLQEHRDILEKDIEAFERLSQDNEDRIAELEEMFQVLDSVSFEEIWQEGEPGERRAIMNTYVKGIFIYRDRCEIEFVNIPPFQVWWDEVSNGKVRVEMERETGLEPATSTLARSRSTN